jgi:hypothetical protein
MGSPDPNAHFFGPLTPSKPSPALDVFEDKLGVGADGTVDRLIKKRGSTSDQRPSMAVFVHAGAGYHSIQNENVHLTMCARLVLSRPQLFPWTASYSIICTDKRQGRPSGHEVLEWWWLGH